MYLSQKQIRSVVKRKVLTVFKEDIENLKSPAENHHGWNYFANNLEREAHNAFGFFHYTSEKQCTCTDQVTDNAKNLTKEILSTILKQLLNN